MEIIKLSITESLKDKYYIVINFSNIYTYYVS